MSTQTIQTTVIDADTTVTGVIDRGRYIEVHGAVEGELEASHVLIHPGGRVFGKLTSENAEIHGVVQGEIAIRHLIDIRATGDVSGKVQYGQLALEAGANLEATVHNIPPVMTGDLDITVPKGKSVIVTTRDLNAIDPDDDAKDLTFTVTKPSNGWLAMANETSRPVKTFTQADLASNNVTFVHDGTPTQSASFEVNLTDGSGASAGEQKRVTVHVR